MEPKTKPDDTGYYWFCGNIFEGAQEEEAYIEIICTVTESCVYLPGIRATLGLSDFSGFWYGPLRSPQSGKKSEFIGKEQSSND